MKTQTNTDTTKKANTDLTKKADTDTTKKADTDLTKKAGTDLTKKAAEAAAATNTGAARQTATAGTTTKRDPFTRPLMRKLDLIVIHCSATRSDISYSPEALDTCHRKRGFNGCGYHFYITRDGLVHAMRPVHIMGAHARGYNAHSIGICYEGGLDPQGRPADTRTLKQKSILHSLVGRLKKEFGITRVVGHRDLSPDRNGDGRITPDEWLKQCPCFDVSKEDY